jgi:uncharacterized protein (UPF0335 family)
MNVGNNSAAQLKAYIERIENLEAEKQAIATDIKDVYAELKSSGYDAAAIRAIIKMRKEDATKRQEREAILETYMNALGMLSDLPLGQAAIERAVA